MTKLIPFGKYKGQPIESLAQDHEYCEWLAGQDWFRTRYTAIHTLIVNNFAVPHETPEHNALQVLFTDDEWVTAFVWTFLGPEWWAALLKRELRTTHEACSQVIASLVETIKDLEQNKYHTDEYIKGYSGKLERIRDNYTRRCAWLNSKIAPAVRIPNLAFEQRGADIEFQALVGVAKKDVPYGVCFDVDVSEANRWYREFLRPPDVCFNFRVECKPTLGDDYPAVLRQMIAHKSNVLLIGRGGYQGVGATYEQMKTIFEASDINVILLADVDTTPAIRLSPDFAEVE